MNVIMRRRLAPLLSALLVSIALMACDATSGVGPTDPGTTPTPCGARCAPPARLPANAHVIQTPRFTLTYLDPWSVQSSDDHSVTLDAMTSSGNSFEVQIVGTDVNAGTSAASLLTTAQQNLDTSKLSGFTDLGPIYGAEIGYVGGVGRGFQGAQDQPGAPSAPVYLQLMASTKGTTGIIFLAVSTLNPSTLKPNAPVPLPNAEFDQLVNGISW